MAKSVGNISLLREVLDAYEPAVVLTYFLTTHYRSPLEFSTAKLDEARAAYARLADALATVDFRIANAARAASRGDWPDLGLRAETARLTFAEHMDDDLNTAAAFGELFALVGDVHRYLADVDRGVAPLDPGALENVREVLMESFAVLLVPAPGVDAGVTALGNATGDSPEVCATGEVLLLPAVHLAEQGRWDDVTMIYADRLACGDASYACVLRDHLRAERLWAEADRLRDELQAAGFDVRDTPQGTQVVRKA